MTNERNAFWNSMTQNVQNAQSSTEKIAFATVQSVVGGKPVLRFSGESAASLKSYKCLKSYVPSVGDRVIILCDIVIGGWVTS